MKGICPWSLVRSRVIISCSGLKKRWRIKKKKRKEKNSCWQIRNNSSSCGFDSSVEQKQKKKKTKLKNLAFFKQDEKGAAYQWKFSVRRAASLFVWFPPQILFSTVHSLSSLCLCNPDFCNFPRSQSTSFIFSSLSPLLVESLGFSLCLPSSLYPSLSISLFFRRVFRFRRSPSSRQGCHGDAGSLALHVVFH